MMAMDSKIGVVTVTFNSVEVLPEFLHCIFSQTSSDLILYALVNAFTDRTVAPLRMCIDSRIGIVVNAENKVVAEGNNQGIRAAIDEGYDLIPLVSNDTAFDKDLVQGLAAGLARNKSAIWRAPCILRTLPWLAACLLMWSVQVQILMSWFRLKQKVFRARLRML